MLRNDSTGTTWTQVVYAYTAADAVTQCEVSQRGWAPGSRVYRVAPTVLHSQDAADASGLTTSDRG